MGTTTGQQIGKNMNGSKWWVDLIKSVGVPTTICLLFMWGVYQVFNALFLPVVVTHTEAVQQTMHTNDDILDELKTIASTTTQSVTNQEQFFDGVQECHKSQLENQRAITDTQAIITSTQQKITENQRAILDAVKQ